MKALNATILVAGLLFAAGGAFALWNGASPPAGSSPEALRIGTANLKAQNGEPERAARALARADADLLLLQEWTGQNAALSVLQKTGLELVFSDPRPGTHGTALLARPGLVESVEGATPPWDGPCAMPLVTAQVRTNDSQLGLLGVHAPPPTSSCWKSRSPYLEATADLVLDGRASRPVGAVSKGVPAILLGDLNATSWAEPIRSLSGKGLKNGHEAGTWSSGATWSPHRWLPALLTLDYVWVPEGWSARGARTTSIPGSDHHALFVDVAIP